MKTLRLKPILGTKIDVPQDDPTLFQWLGEGYALTHDVGGQNISYVRKRNACSKSYGKFQWSNSAISSATGCQGLFELDDGTNVDHLIIDHGKFYYYDSSNDPTNIDASGGISFTGLCSMIQFADYIVIADGTLTPYKWKHGDANLTKLILAGGATEYKFRYLLEFQRRIFGAYSDQTNGDIEIRWTDALPTMASLDFDSANQLYKPAEYDPITGISKLGANAVYLYGEESICRIDYYPGAAIPFGITQTVAGHGSVNHHSIVNDGQANYFFDKNYGFVKYQGGSEIQKESIISSDIEPWITGISPSYQNLIVGTALPFVNEICWTVPLSGTANNALLFYNTKTGQWRKLIFAAAFAGHWVLFQDYTWDDLIAEYTTWPTTMAWDVFVSEQSYLVFANTDGHLYTNHSETDAGSALNGYRIEPILDFGNPNLMKRVLEIWFGIQSGGDYDLHVYWRGGDTVGECEATSWESLGDLNINNPANAVLYVDRTARFHQIRWGTNGTSEPFSVNEIRLNYQAAGRY